MAQSTEPRTPRGFQFSIVKLLALIGGVAIVCVALRTPTTVWAAVVFLLAMIGALAGGLGILFRTGRARAFAVGFFAGCVGYAACLLVIEKRIGGQLGDEREMPTTQLASWMFGLLHPQSTGGYIGMGGGGFDGMSSFGGGSSDMSGMSKSGPGGPPPPVAIPVYYQLTHFVVIVHSALAVLLGLAGGVIAQCFYTAKRELSEGRPSNP
jgi:hypothetical protein